MSSPKAASPTSKTSKRPKVNVNPAQFKRRLESELRYFKAHSKDSLCKYKLVAVEDRRWNLLFLPDKEPYNVGAYQLVVDFPPEYPFRPPSMAFKTKIYHPNIGEKGNLELNLCNAESWKPTIRMFQLCDYIISLLNYPQSSNAVRKDIAEQMSKNRDSFIKEATIHSKSNSEKRV